MANIHEAIFALNPNIISISGMDAFDKNGAPVQYDLAAAQAKLVELQAAEAKAEQDAIAAKASALAKLAKLGLTEDEVKALIG